MHIPKGRRHIVAIKVLNNVRAKHSFDGVRPNRKAFDNIAKHNLPGKTAQQGYRIRTQDRKSTKPKNRARVEVGPTRRARETAAELDQRILRFFHVETTARHQLSGFRLAA